MRIKRKIQLAGLAVVLAGGVSGTAEAGDRTINDDITTPVTTSNPDGSAVAGDITVGADGSITIGPNETAITVDSSNDVTIDGALLSEDADNSIGISIEGGNSGTITHSGSISLTEDYTLEDTDDDGDFDGDVAIGTNRHGIFLQAGPTFTGDIIVDGGGFVIEGNNSSAITLDALLTGNLDVTGSISVTGENSYGIAVNEGITGDMLINAPLTVRGANSVGVYVGGDVGGELSLTGSWGVTGYLSTAIPEDQLTLEPGDVEQAGSALVVSGSVANGVTLEGIGVENDEDDDDDGEDNEADDNAGVAINQFGSAAAVHIFGDGSNIVLGPGTEGYGFYHRGSITSAGVFDGVSATGIRIDGLGGTATINGGMLIDGLISASASEANSYAVIIGDGGIVPSIEMRNIMTSSVASETAQTAYGYFFDTGASVSSFNNSGSLIVTYFGETGDSYAIQDLSGTLDTITNSGRIVAQNVATDDDLSDDIPPPPITGDAIAIDVSANTTGVVLDQVEPVVFTDQDSNDNFIAPDTAIIGDILFGTGADTVNLEFGDIIGDISFNAGADVFTIDGAEAVFSGHITDSDGALTLNINQGLLDYQGGTLDITSLTIGNGGELAVFLSDVPADTSFIEASGIVTFLAGSTVTPVVPDGLPDFGSQVFLTANGGMFGASNVVGVLSGDNIPFLYNVAIQVTDALAADGDPNSLEALYQLKTPVELGLSTNQTVAFDEIIDALRRDSAAAGAMSRVTTEYEFFDAYEDLLPNYGPGATEIAATAIQQMQSATSNRMAATRMQGLDEVSVWAQEIAYGVNREPPNSNSQEFRGHGFGFAFGIDGPTDNGAIFGLSASFVASEVEEPGRPEGEIATWLGQLNAYYATAVGPVDLDFVVGGGGGQMQSRRFVEIGNPVTFSALSEGDWWAYEGHGSARASLPLSAGWFVVTPQVALTYVGLGEQGYTESGGGAAVDYIVDDVFTQRLWGDAGLEFSAKWNLGGSSVIAPRVYVGYRGNLLDEESERTVQFVSGGSPFTLTDEGVGEGGPLFGIGFDATNGYSTFSLGYEGEFGDQIDRHSINAAIRFRF